MRSIRTNAAPSVQGGSNTATDQNGNQYFGMQQLATWTKAQQLCTELGTGWNLASIIDAVTGEAVQGDQSCQGTLRTTTYWTGLCK